MCTVPELPLQQTGQDRRHKFTGRELECGTDAGIFLEGKFAADFSPQPLGPRTFKEEMPRGFLVFFQAYATRRVVGFTT